MGCARRCGFWDLGVEDLNGLVVPHWDNGKENGNYYIIMGYLLGLYRGYIGIMEKKMETTIIMGCMGDYREQNP